jgi:anti-sigma factor RsiW
MEKKELMDNGWLELYLLGDLSTADAQLVEQALDEDNELRKMYQAMEADMETVAKENAVDPSPLVKERLFRQLELSPAEIKRKEVPVRKINPTIYTLVAASIALVFILSSIWLYQKVNVLKSDLQLVETNLDQLNLDKETLASELGSLKDELAVLRMPKPRNIS